MKSQRYKVIGWYSSDPLNEHIVPFARVIFINVAVAAEANHAGAVALEKLTKDEEDDLLNWYVTEVK